MRETATRTSVRFGVRRGSDESSSLFVSPLSPAFRLVLWRNPPFLFSPRGFLFASPPASYRIERARRRRLVPPLSLLFLPPNGVSRRRSPFEIPMPYQVQLLFGNNLLLFPSPFFSTVACFPCSSFPSFFSHRRLRFLEKKQMFPILFSPVPVFLSRLDRANFEFRVCPPVTQFPPIAKGEGGDDGK